MKKLPATAVRRRLFLTLLGIIVSLLTWAELDSRLDTAIVSYGICIVLLTPTIVILVYRATRRHASDMYWIIILLCLGIDWAMVCQFWARWVWIVYGMELYAGVLQSTYWGMRNALEIVSIAYLASWTAGRIFGERDNGLIGIPDDREMALKSEMIERFSQTEARITAGEVRFSGHTHDQKGLVLEAKLIVEMSDK